MPLDTTGAARPRPTGLALWGQAVSFQLRHAGSLIVMLPCFVVPVLCDAVYTVLFRQWDDDGRLNPGDAFEEAARLTPSLFGLMLRSEIKATLWSLLFVFGIPQVVRHRIAWGYSSNVMVFEGRRGEDAYARSEQLAAEHYALGLRALVTVPSLLGVGSFLLITVATELSHSALLFWLWVIVVWWIVMPGAATVNTLLYLATVPRQQRDEPRNAIKPTGT
jgi:hypothetical protein